MEKKKADQWEVECTNIKKGDVAGFFNRHHELLEDVHRVDRVADPT